MRKPKTKPQPGSRGRSTSPSRGKGETWQQVAKSNKIKDPRKLQIGSKVKVNGATRTVKKGDTLWGMTHGPGKAKTRGKSASAPGHTKPPGQKNAVGRGKTKPGGNPSGNGIGKMVPSPRPGGNVTPLPTLRPSKPTPITPRADAPGRIGQVPPSSRPPSTKPVDPGFNRPTPIPGSGRPIPGGTATYKPMPIVAGPRTPGSMTPVVGTKSGAGVASSLLGSKSSSGKPVAGSKAAGLARPKQGPSKKPKPAGMRR